LHGQETRLWVAKPTAADGLAAQGPKVCRLFAGGEPVSENPRFLSKTESAGVQNQVRSEACCALTIINFCRARLVRDAGKVFRGFRNIKTTLLRETLTIDFGGAKLLKCQSIVQIILTTSYSTAPNNITSSWPANSNASLACLGTAFLSSGFCWRLVTMAKYPAKPRLCSALGTDPDTDHSRRGRL